MKNYNLSILILISIAISSCMKSEKADLIVHNATIYSVNSGFETFTAMAIKDGKVIELGPEREILNRYRADEHYDAKKQFIYPGFYDAHCHLFGYALALQQVNLYGTSSEKEVMDKISAFAKTYKGDWILGRGWDQNDWQIKEFPTKEKLDSLFPTRPVFVRRVDGHAALANSEALRRAGIKGDESVSGGQIILLSDGTPSGVLVDNAMDLVGNIIPETDEAFKVSALKQAEDSLLSKGLTTVSDADMSNADMKILEKLNSENQLRLNVYVMLSSSEENFTEYLPKGPYQDKKLNVRAFKFVADGALGSRGACLLEPYSDIIGNSHYGTILKDYQFYKEKAALIYGKGFQMNTHCIGDSANKMMLGIYAEVLKGTNDKRWRIEHAQVLDADDFSKFKEFNIVPSVQPTHATSDMYWAGNRLGEERIKIAYAYKTLLQSNGLIALGTDFPIENINPMHTFYSAVARKDLKHFPEDGFQMENALSRVETLMGMTIWAAIASFEENEKGSLEPGKKADFVVLDRDIMKVDEKLLPNTKVKNTFIAGKKVY